MYTPEQIKIIEQHYNWSVRQDSDGNLAWNDSPDAETGWRPVSDEQRNEIAALLQDDGCPAPQYEAYRYAADGHAGEEGDGEIICAGTLAECRAAIRQQLGSYMSEPAAQWDGLDDDIEAYHESSRTGCGGYAIRVAKTNDIPPLRGE